MQKLKAKQWERISEGLVSVDELMNMQDAKGHPSVNMVLQSIADPTKVGQIQIVRKRGPFYEVLNQAQPTSKNNKLYKYLSCAVRFAVKQYKVALRSGQWKMMTK